MEQALYRKYRPRDFKSAIAQDHIVKTLKNAIASGRISHAYLFTGPRGVGKTSIARILAHEINGLNYTDDSIHLDIIEIDAASNRRIDEIRDLRDRVRIAPAAAKYKVYIIDEVHMLTREAFNALLKTLEEPPAHCVFILATTEAHKLPETIISRTQRFEFKPVNPLQMADHLKSIASQEKIDITPEALELLAKYGDGSFRDSIGYLDQLSAYKGKIDGDTVRQVLGMPTSSEIGSLLKAMGSGDVRAAADCLNGFQAHGVSPNEVAAGLSEAIREKIISGAGKVEHAGLLKDLMRVGGSARPQELLEIAVLGFSMTTQSFAEQGNGRSKESNIESQPEKPKEQTAHPAEANKSSSEFNLSEWSKVVDLSKSRAASIYTALRLAKPALEGDKLILEFAFPLHQKKLNQAANKELVASIIEELYGRKLSIECIVNKRVKDLPKAKPSAGNNEIHAISNIFGGAEMMEA